MDECIGNEGILGTRRPCDLRYKHRFTQYALSGLVHSFPVESSFIFDTVPVG